MAVTSAVAVHPANTGQLRAWDGDEGAFWAAHADHFERSLARYDEALLLAAALRPADRVLDVGCGTGSTTRAIAHRAPDGTVLGVDLSAPMLEVARRRAAGEGLGAVRFEQADAQVHPFPPASLDVVVSRTGAMFFGDPVAAFGNLGRALVPGGRLALLVWQPPAANEWFQEIRAAFAAGRELPMPPTGAPGPFAFADPDRLRDVLGAAGFTAVGVVGLCEPMWFGTDPGDAVSFVAGLAGWMLAGLDEPARGRALDALRRSAEAHRGADGVEFGSATWLVTARRPAPG